MNDQIGRFRRTLDEINRRMNSKYQIIESLDMRTKIKSYKIYLRGHLGNLPPIEAGFNSYEIAQARIIQLEAEEKP